MKTFPTLYKKTSTGALQEWNIRVEGSTIVVTYGQTGGKMQETRETIAQGKNIGRSNETTPEYQAELEAQGQWEKKSKKRYVTDPSAAMNGEVDQTYVVGGVDPMLAQTYAKHGSKITFPALAQPKLDGHRCIAMVSGDEVSLWTRTRKPITGVPHVVEALQAMGLPYGTVLDGELYNHDYRSKFEELTSFIRSPNPKLGCEAVQYHVYDLASSKEGFEDRFFDLEMLLTANMHRMAPGPIRLVETIAVDDEAAMTEAFAHFVEQGYEGLMIRNAQSPYLNKRSYDLQKVKEFEDAEFKIVGVVEGRGRLAGHGIFVCVTKDGTEFQVKMAGALDNLIDVYQNPQNYVGKMLTVQYQGITNASEVPRFPVGLRFRQDI